MIQDPPIKDRAAGDRAAGDRAAGDRAAGDRAAGEGAAGEGAAGALTVQPDWIEAAAVRIAGAVQRTPLHHSRTLSALSGVELFVKFENLQFTASFKERGALNRLLALSAAERQRGVIAVSAGNHAQGVAYHAQRLGIPALILMPRHTPFIKVSHTRAFGAEVVLVGDSLAECWPAAEERMAERGLTLIHPFDDPLVIAGQGTIGLEVLADRPELERIIVPIGGGGLIGGIALAVKTRRPDIQIIGVESAVYPGMRCALEGGPEPEGGTSVAEGIAVKRPGRHTLPLVRRLVDEVVVVPESTIEEAINLYFAVEKTVAEGAGAAALAAVLAEPARFAGRKTALILSGGNIDSRLMAAVIMRGLVREGRILRLSIAAVDLPGQLARVAGLIAGLGGNILEVQHERLLAQLAPTDTDLDITLELPDPSQAEIIIARLRDAGYRVAVKSLV